MAAHKILMYLGLTLLGINMLVSGMFVLGAKDTHQQEGQQDIGEVALLHAPAQPQPVEQSAEAHVTETQLAKAPATEHAVEPGAEVIEHAPAEESGHEQAPTQAHMEEHAVEPPPAEPAIEEEYVQCYRLGPLHNELDTGALMDQLKQVGLNVVISSQKEGEVLGYWVHLPPERSLTMGRLKVEELKTRGIKDLMLVIKDEPKYAISLGLYRNKLTAQKRQQHIQSLGYPAALSLRYKSKPETWLTVEATNKTEPSEDGWNFLLKDYPSVTREKSDC